MENSSVPQKFTVPIGPQHPALKEPGHFEFTVDGEIVTGASLRLGYVHRGIEKAAESRNWVQDLYLIERVCGICSHIHALAYTLSVEKLAGVTAPPRAQAIRTLFAELERIHSHLLWLGVAAHEGGFETLFMYTWRDRERVMDVLELISGNRVHYSANVLGGVKFDVTSEQADAVREMVSYLEDRTEYYLKVVTSDETFLRRTQGIGLMSKEEASRWGAVGPTARASGVARDMRVDSPYAAYPEFPIQMVTDSAGDLEARFVVRIKELFESYRVIRNILDNLPESELQTRMPRRIAPGEAITRVEAPRGELFYFVKSSGGDHPDRVKIRTPSLANWSSITQVAVGHKLADMPMLLVGIDPCFSCNDRMVLVHDNHEIKEWTWDDLRRHGVSYYNESCHLASD